MLIGNYYAPKELVEATTTTLEAQPLPEGPTTGPQNTGTQAVVSPGGGAWCTYGFYVRAAS